MERSSCLNSTDVLRSSGAARLEILASENSAHRKKNRAVAN
jgi:hypothetical protein